MVVPKYEFEHRSTKPYFNCNLKNDLFLKKKSMHIFITGKSPNKFSSATNTDLPFWYTDLIWKRNVSNLFWFIAFKEYHVKT